ncbi:MAG: T9SS type A sorting domain-containing protein [Porphyromonadaceae bacterium]|nr:T9SS type A sorting domain-containing protein [Porphyromonadaceae bacterium]
MRRLILALILGLPWLMFGQGELWQTWLVRRHTTSVAATDRHLFAVADGSLFSVDRDNPDQIDLYDRANGLSDVDIRQIAWSDVAKRLVIYYASGGIDLLSSAGVEHIDALKASSQMTQRTLRQIATRGVRAWLAGDFGIVQLNVARGQIEAIYWANQPVKSVAISADGKEIACVDTEGVKVGLLTNNLQDPSMWHTIALKPEEPKSQWKAVGYADDRLIALATDGALYHLQGQKADKILQQNIITRLLSSGDELLALSEASVFAVDNNLSLHLVGASSGDYSPTGSAQKGRLWQPTGGREIVSFVREGDVWVRRMLEPTIDGPESNIFFAIKHRGKHLYAVGGGRGADRFHTKGVVQLFDGKRWSALVDTDVEAQSGVAFRDPVDILPHRDGQASHYYVATWGEGLYEFLDGKLVNRFHEENSTLTSAIIGSPYYVRVGSLAYDRRGNLWVAQGGAEGASVPAISRMSPEGKWYAYDYPTIRGTNSFHTHIVLPNGTKWLLDNHKSEHGEGVFVYQDSGTDDLSDDVSAHYSSMTELSGRSVNFSKLTAMALDRRGVLWIGSNIGYFSVLNPGRDPQPSRPPTVSRPIGGEAPSLFYVLDNVPITAIAVDGMNRKWMGTESSGLYLISEDGLKVLRHYHKDNCPLLDNRILSLAMDEHTGKLYIGTGFGLNVLETATSADHQTKRPSAIAYPNPLRPEDPDGITLEGLPAGANIHISDASGRLVHQARSVDQSYRWDTYTNQGVRLPSGVYYIRIYAPDGSESQLISVSIIRSID